MNAKNVTKKHIRQLIIPLTFFGGLLGIGIFIGIQKTDYSTWETTIGEVVSRTYGRQGARIIEYKANNNVYEARGGYYGECIGDKYLIIYNPLEFKQIRVHDHRPVFEESELTGYTHAIIIDDAPIEKYDKYWRVIPRYKYYVQGERYKRDQVIHIPIDSSIHIKKGAKFRVQYWVENP